MDNFIILEVHTYRVSLRAVELSSIVTVKIAILTYLIIVHFRK